VLCGYCFVVKTAVVRLVFLPEGIVARGMAKVRLIDLYLFWRWWLDGDVIINEVSISYSILSSCAILLIVIHVGFPFLVKSEFDSKVSCPFWQDVFVATA
jgi:hypothetical protein